MDKRFVLPNIEYMWTDRDQVFALEVYAAYKAERDAGKSYADALNALRGKVPTHKFYASPYKMLIPLFTQANPEKLWHQIIVPGETVVLSQSEFLRKCDSPKHAKKQIKKYALWKKLDHVEWTKVKGAERDAIRNAGSLGGALQALHALDPNRFQAALYGKESTGFTKFARRIFDFWGNSEYRRHATSSGHGFDYAHQTKTIHQLKPVIAGKSPEYVPVFVPPKTTQPITPNKNKIAATKPVGFEAHVSKLKSYAATNIACHGWMDNLRSHQSRAEGIAKSFEAFHQIYPGLISANLPAAAAAARRLSTLSDEEVFKKNVDLFTSPPPASLGGMVRATRPSSPPLARGLESTADIIRLMSQDPEAAKSAHAYAAAALNANRGLGHTYKDLEEINFALRSVTMCDNTLAQTFEDMAHQQIMAAPEDGVTSASQLSSPPKGASPGSSGSSQPGFGTFLLELNGTHLPPWAKFVPQVLGNYQGPPSLSVALANAAGFVARSKLNQEGHLGQLANRNWQWIEKFFSKDVRDRMRTAVNTGGKGALTKFLKEEFRTPQGVKIFGRDAGTPLPAGDVQSVTKGTGRLGAGIFGVVGICQLLSQIETLRKLSETGLQPGASGVFEVAAVTISSVQTVSVVVESALQVKAWTEGVAIAAKSAQRLQQANIYLAGASSLVGFAQNFYEAGKSYRQGQPALAVLKGVKGTAHGVLFVVMFFPHPVVQAGALLVLVGAEVIEAIWFSEGKVVELSSPVNDHLRGLAKLAKSKANNPLAPFLTDGERAAIAHVEAACNFVPITYPLAGTAFDPLGQAKADAKKLRDVGFTLLQTSDLLGRMLSVDDLA